MKKTLLGLLVVCSLFASVGTVKAEEGTGSTEISYTSSGGNIYVPIEPPTKPNKGPSTGDASNTALWALMTVGSGLLLFLIFWKRDEKEDDEKIVYL